METKPMRVLLYYKYVNIEDPETLTQEHLKYCKDLGIKGRILISSEGINGTCSGTWEQTEQYMNDLKANPLFSDIEFKIDEVEEHAFKKIFVRHKKELVTWRFDGEFDVPKQHGAYLEPAEWKEMMNRDDVVILDVRNNYEYELGHFKNAIKIDVEASRYMPEWLEENKDLYEGKHFSRTVPVASVARNLQHICVTLVTTTSSTLKVASRCMVRMKRQKEKTGKASSTSLTNASTSRLTP